MLGCEQPQKANSAGAPEEDENYELEVYDLNQVWKVDAQTNELVPIEEYFPFSNTKIAESNAQTIWLHFENDS